MSARGVIAITALAVLVVDCGGGPEGDSGGAVLQATVAPSAPPIEWLQVAAGDAHTIAVRTDSTLWAWGDNTSGQLGDGNDGPSAGQLAPLQIGTGYRLTAAGASHTIAVKADGTLWAWGSNSRGQLGDGTTTNRNAPIQVGSGYAFAAAGAAHAVGLKTDGTLWAWGANDDSQLGDGTTANRVTPGQVGSGYASVAAGGGTVAVRTDRTLWTWGTSVPLIRAPLQFGMGYSSVAAGRWHCVAVKADGTLWAWGDNTYGQLGDGTTTNRYGPEEIYASVPHASGTRGPGLQKRGGTGTNRFGPGEIRPPVPQASGTRGLRRQADPALANRE